MSAVRQALRQALRAALPRTRFLVRGPRRDAAIALTFDDGPHPEITPQLLDLLAQRGACGTFFVIGHLAERYPALITRMIREGHAVGHHSWTHTEPAATPAGQLLDEVARCRALLESLGVQTSDRFRPPKGQLSAAKLLRLLGAGQRIVLWSNDPKDYALADAAPLVEWARSAPLVQGDVVLLHDTKAHCLAAMPVLLDRAKNERRPLVTLDAWLPGAAHA